MLSFLEAGLDDLSVSRTSFKWGIPVPDDPAHVMYVWFDALDQLHDGGRLRRSDGAAAARLRSGTGRRTCTSSARRSSASTRSTGRRSCWPPALPLPRQVVSHGWWLMEGAKMSKSKGNVVRPHDYIERFGLDAVRYFVFREMVFGQDASFSDEAILTGATTPIWPTTSAIWSAA